MILKKQVINQIFSYLSHDNQQLKKHFSILILLIIIFCSCKNQTSKKNEDNSSDFYSGSTSCIECHERFYKLWAPSHHGKAMQPVTADFIQNEVKLGQAEITIESATYQAIQKDTLLFIREIKDETTTDYEVLWALGGKNVYYFLTPFEDGRLQTLPLAYDVNTNEWYNNPGSAIRHFPHVNGTELGDQALSWRDHLYTFNTSCYSCHVSQLENNFDLATNTYKTNWREAGINCETCHGPCTEHILVCRKAGEDNVPKDLKIISTSTFTPDQLNASCAPCHAKMRPITSSYTPGNRYFDNYDLTTLENLDFYPDGRDLGENYTMTGWYMNACQQESDIHCVTCHTSSGRYRFKSKDLVEANKACTSCHYENEAGYEKHTNHIISEKSPKCVECHMPMTRFGKIGRSDHSFRPPMPAATIKFGSPNACIICHSDKNDEWANHEVSQWKNRDYQKETLYIGGLIAEAREEKWERLDKMLDAIRSNKYGQVFTTSLIRLLTNCKSEKKWPVLIEALHFESPLSRSAAALGLLGNRSNEAKHALFQAAKDKYRLVRLAAAQSLATFSQQEFTVEQANIFSEINQEYEQSLIIRSDDWSSHYNLGIHYQNMGKTEQAIVSYENSLKIYPEAILSLVNCSFLYSLNGNQDKAADYLSKAIKIEPENEVANLNYGLLMAEMNRLSDAETALRKVLEVNVKNATAAYNLSIIVSSRNLDEACQLSEQAMNESPENPKFAYTYAYFLKQNKQQDKAIVVLEKILKDFRDNLSSVFLLGNIYVENGNKNKAIDLYSNTLKLIQGNLQAQYQLQKEIERIKAM